MMTTYPPRAETFLAELETAAGSLTPGDRFELLADIRAHLDEAIPSGATDEQVQAAVSSLGTPGDIVAAAGGQNPPHAAPAVPPQVPPQIIIEQPQSRLDTQAVIGLVLAVAGWLIVPFILPIAGWVLIATSNRWRGSQKLIAFAIAWSIPPLSLLAALVSRETTFVGFFLSFALGHLISIAYLSKKAQAPERDPHLVTRVAVDHLS